MRRRPFLNSRHYTTVLSLMVLFDLVIAPVVGSPSSPRTILVIFAHPDDDITIGPLLAHYAKRGVRLYLAIVTSGQKGVTPHAKIPAGDELGAVREAEARAACQAYGIAEPYLLREQDGTLSSMQRHNEISARLREIMRQVRPSIVITWGPDGLTGHPDHRAVSNLVTEVFQMWEAPKKESSSPRKLYYVAFPQSKFSEPVPPFPERLASVNDSYVTTIITARDGLAAAARAEESYKSQHTPEVMKAFNEMMDKTLHGRVYLRLALQKSGRFIRPERDVFDGLH